MSRVSIKKYAYCIIYYEEASAVRHDGIDAFERGECKAFVELLKQKFCARAHADGKEYKVFSEWSEQFGGNKVTDYHKFGKNSYFTIVLYSPNLKSDRLNKYFSESFFSELVETGRFIPVLINGAVAPDHLNVTNSLNFARDFRSDQLNWDKLVTFIYRKRKHFTEAQLGGGSDSETSEEDDWELDEEPKGGMCFYSVFDL